MDIYHIDQEKIVRSTFHVEIKEHQDWHFATCKELDGLFVGHKSYDTVLKNIPECIGLLLKNDRGQEVIVTEEKHTKPTQPGHKTYVATTKVAA